MIVTAVFLAASFGYAGAEIREGSVVLNPQIGGYVFEGNQNIGNDATYGLGLGYNFTEHWGIEGNFNFVDTESVSPSGDVKAYIYRLDGLYHLMPGQKLVPYAAFGAGVININGDVDDEGTEALLNYGAGIKYFLTDNIALRGDVRHIITGDPDNNLVYTVGLTFQFGGKEKMEAMPAAAPSLVVSEEKPVVPEAKPPVPAPLPEEPVVEAPPPAKEKVVVLEDVHFEFSKATLTEEAKTVLKKNIEELKENPEVAIRIEGHSCAHGPTDYNLKLSAKRADAVKAFLVREGGIAAERMTIIAYGESRLAMPEVPTPRNKESVEARTNRRVHFEVIVH